MLTRRRALSLLGIAGIGTVAFQRALAATADGNGAVTREMVANAEWVAGITLSDEQRQAAAEVLNSNHERLPKLRAVKLDYGLAPPFVFTPLSSPASAPDQRGYRRAKSAGLLGASGPRPTNDEDIAFSSLRTLGQLLRNRQISSTELTKLYLERLHRYDALLKCVATFTDELAFKQAALADRELQQGLDRGPLHGIPWGVKDVISYPGYPTTWGAPQYRHRILDTKAAVAERLEQAGAVLIAKLATGAFAGMDFWFRGSTRNPWNPNQDASGSSSGAAAATVAGLVGFSIGTETMGSIIFPSARCGAVGLRPTFGRVSRLGCMPLGWTLDKIGPICRSADDCGLVLGAIHGADPRDPSTVDRDYIWPSTRELKTIRVGHFRDNDDDDQRADLAVLRNLGVTLVPIDLPKLPDDIDLPIDFLEATLTVESSAIYEDLTLRQEPKGVKMWPTVWAWGHFLSGIDYLKICRVRTLLMRCMDELMQKVDICLGDDGRTITNLTGHPKIVLPKEFIEQNGFTIPRPQAFFGRLYDESTMLALADAYQRALGHRQRPPLEKYLADKDKFHAGEEFPDENKLYLD
jgi:Asp-tRNA(Asn)/Glu-tRNA(Gln) amidotransferase A subunit family amidase